MASLLLVARRLTRLFWLSAGGRSVSKQISSCKEWMWFNLAQTWSGVISGLTDLERLNKRQPTCVFSRRFGVPGFNDQRKCSLEQRQNAFSTCAVTVMHVVHVVFYAVINKMVTPQQHYYRLCNWNNPFTGHLKWNGTLMGALLDIEVWSALMTLVCPVPKVQGGSAEITSSGCFRQILKNIWQSLCLLQMCCAVWNEWIFSSNTPEDKTCNERKNYQTRWS